MEPKKKTTSFTVKAVRNGYIVDAGFCTLVAKTPHQLTNIIANAVVDMIEDIAESEQVKIDVEVNGI